jgi:hypothetical protein
MADRLAMMSGALAELDRGQCQADLYVSMICDADRAGFGLPALLVGAAAAAQLSIQCSMLVMYEEDESESEVSRFSTASWRYLIMIELTAKLPENLYQQVIAIAAQENLSFDQVIEIALSAQLKAWSERDYLADDLWSVVDHRAQKGSWEDFQSILAQVPDRDPEPFDRL